MRTFLFFVLLAFPIMAFSQSIHGTVSDVDGNPMQGVKVVAEGTTHGTLTDDQGKYLLNVSNGTAVTAIVFTSKLYKKPMKIKMKEGLMVDTRVFVTMHKKKRKRKFTLVN